MKKTFTDRLSHILNQWFASCIHYTVKKLTQFRTAIIVLIILLLSASGTYLYAHLILIHGQYKTLSRSQNNELWTQQDTWDSNNQNLDTTIVKHSSRLWASVWTIST